MTVFISGGCKNGKSSHAEKIACSMQNLGHPLYYLATMEPHDSEDETRIARHQQSRDGMGFTTIEIGRDMETVLTLCDKNGSFLLDSATALLANEMFLMDGSVNADAPKKVAQTLASLIKLLPNLVIVSDFICSDAEMYDSFTEDYRRGLAYIDKTCARLCGVVLEACCGTIITHKGGNLLEAY